MRILFILSYLGVGALAHLIFAGDEFRWNSASTWVWLFAWPLPLIATAAVIALVMALGAKLAGRLY